MILEKILSALEDEIQVGAKWKSINIHDRYWTEGAFVYISNWLYDHSWILIHIFESWNIILNWNSNWKKMLWMIFSRGLKIGYIDCQGMQTCYKVNFGEVFLKKKEKSRATWQNHGWWFFFISDSTFAKLSFLANATIASSHPSMMSSTFLKKEKSFS